ncbi:hypothetical protein AAVH_18634 [Aphelenchoides avenae]|nr:hypothetical protein AAVH_18634 [Aphelenchus avenae]
MHTIKADEVMCKVALPSDLLLHFDRRPHSRPTVVAWSCRLPYACCGLDCCAKSTTTTQLKAADNRRTTFVVIGGFMLVTIAVGILLEWETRRKEKEAMNATSKPTTTHYQCSPTYVGSLGEPPLPLATCLARSHFVFNLNTDFRCENDTGRTFFRGGTRCLGVIYCDGWLGCIGSYQEWAVAYHGTTCENISGIIQCGLDLKLIQRCTYGKGIYCAPSPVIAREYSTPYEARGRWYTAVLQVRVDPRIKKAVFNDGGDEYWIVPQADAIRPYGVCVYEVSIPR